MSITDYILTTFSSLPIESRYVNKVHNSLLLKTTNDALIDINQDEILLARSLNLLDKVRSESSKTDIIRSDKMIAFLKQLEEKFIRLNHVGISYFYTDLEAEMALYKQALKNTGLKIYQEESESVDEKWCFIGNTADWEAPLCEIVLNASVTNYYQEWVPAFQVDIDTTFTMEELEDLSQKHFGKHFWKWKLNVPDYGVVLAMAILGKINGTKITFGVGTNLRDTKEHRKSMQEVA